MAFIDWSDPEDMLGLLLDLVADERAQCLDDPGRQRFLADLLAQLRTVDEQLPEISTAAAIQRLKDAYQAGRHEFARDTVMVHLQHCIEELERVAEGAS